MTQDSAAGRFALALAAAARRYASGLCGTTDARLDMLEARSVLARLGIPLRLLSAPSFTAPLSAQQRTEALSRLRAENGRMVRLARKASPAYDLDRHIAVRRLLARLDGTGVIPASS